MLFSRLQDCQCSIKPVMKLKPFLIPWLIVCLLAACVNAIAQNTAANYFLPTVFPKSPGSAAFAKYGDYQVNLFTGVPDISIPLYTIQSGSLEVPVTLSYHASGIKVSDVAGWAGLGWSVSAGGSITRKVMGLPDDSGTGLLQPGMWRNSINVDATDADINYASNVVLGYYDSQPDIYSYDFPGHSGKFFFEGSNGLKPALVPFAPISISYSAPVSPNYLLNFSILNEHGDSYNFGKTYTESTSTVASGHTTSVKTGWMLEKMISQNRRDTISFSYTPQVMTYPDETSQVDLVEDEQISVTSTTTHYTPKYTPHFNNSSSSSSVGEQDVNTIFFKNGKVIFDLDYSQYRQDQSTHPLKDIQVLGYNYSTKSYQMQKKVVFYTSYFYPGVTNQARLRLDSIQVQDAAGAVIQHYRFIYNTAVTMPAYGSLAKDYWGYYNGKDNSNSLIPQFVFTANSGGGIYTYNIGAANPAYDNRVTDSVSMKALVLQSIYYPTGGHTDFTYQANQYLNDSGTPTLAGGLRIASIRSYDNLGSAPVIKTYQYNQARANFILDYSYFLTAQTHRYWESDPIILSGCGNSQTERYTSIVSNPHTDPTPFDQALVVYPSVTEYVGTPGSNTGRTDYIYRDWGDNRQTSRAGTPIIQSNFYRRGQLSSKTDYMRKSDGTYQIVKKDSSTYTAFAQNGHGIAGWVIDKTAWDEGSCTPGLAYYNAGSNFNPNALNQFVAQNYSITSDDNYLTGTTSYIYDTSDPTKYTTSTVAYKYDNLVHQQVSRTYHTDSRGNTNVTVSKYPADYLSGTTTYNAVLDTMLNHNMQTAVVEKWDSLKNVTTGVNAVTGGQLNVYGPGHLGGILPYKISTLSVAAPLTGFVPASVVSGITGDSRYVQMISFDNYDIKDNIAQYTPRNTTSVSLIWDYQYGLPIAQVKNAKNPSGVNQNVAYTSFEADGKGNWNFSGTPVSDVTAPDGLNSYNLSSGTISATNLDNTKSYIVSYWSNNGPATVNSAGGTALRTAKGWSYYEHTVPAGTTMVVVSGTTSIDALRLYPSTAQMTTYGYSPSGLTSIMDTKGQNTYFEYDFFQRLKNAKDWNGNIIKNYGYHTYDQTAGNQAQTGTFTRNNCPSGSNPQSLTYTVPANRYYSSTLASANADAVYDLNVNGQIKANTVCGCPVVSLVNFTLTNNTGLGGFQARFTGTNTYNFNFPTSGSVTVSLPADSYSLFLPGVSPFDNHTFTVGSQSPVTAPSATFNVVISTTSSDTFARVQ
ncbi:MAG: hypothetical protein JWR02_3025 [Mucilaginibacter sp.]|nr:hypothetical protein [Mucilaginibacter sp.]